MGKIHDIVYPKKSKKKNTLSSLLIIGKIITNSKDLAENFKQFFLSILGQRFKATPSYQWHYIDYLKHPNPETFFVSPTTPNEIKNIIKSFESSKCVVQNRITRKIIHLIKVKISILLSELISKFFSTGCFSNIGKTTKVIPIFKTESTLLCNNDRPISLLSNVSKITQKIINKA